MMLSTLFSTSWVRSIDVAGGKATSTMNTPLSSVGTNPVGVVRSSRTKIPVSTMMIPKATAFMCTIFPTRRRYLSFIASKNTLKALWKREAKEVPFPCSSLAERKTAHSAGLNVRALTAEIRMAIASVIPNWV